MIPSTLSLRASKKLRARKANLYIESLEERQLLAANAAYSFVPTDILIQLKTGASTPQGAQVLAGTTIGPEISLVPGLHQVSLAPGVTVDQALTAYRNNPAVLYAETDDVVHQSAVPNDAYYAEDQWALNNTGQTGGTPGDDINAQAAWNVTTGSSSIIVATLDSGIDYTHPDLAANVWTNPGDSSADGKDNDNDGFVDDTHGWNFVSNTNNVMDDYWHGTHVAGIIGAVGNNGIGVTGVNWHIQIMPLKMLDSSGNGSTANAVLALNYAVAHGARVVNISWNGGPYSQAFHDAIQNAGAKGVLIVCAAGNDNANDDASINYPPSYDLPNMIVVAATDANDNIASFSNYGASTVSLAAPGVNVLSTVPGNGYEYADGTSMATPQVTGAAALLLAADPNLSVADLKARLLGGTDYIGNVGNNGAKPTATNGILDIGNSIKPDLSWNSLTSPGTVQVGQSFTITGSYHDSGSNAGTFTISYYRSSDGVFGDGDDVLLGKQTVSGVKVGSFNVTSPSFTLPQGGSYTVFAQLDSGGAVSEFDETNNVAGSTMQATAGTSFSINNISVTEGNSGTTKAVFTVTLSSPLTTTATVKYTTVNGTATAGSDFTATSGTLTFSAGQTSKTITVSVKGDTQVEPDETFSVQLSSPTKAALGNASGTCTILNDDGSASVSIADTSVTNVTSGTINAVFTVSLSSALSAPVTVNYATSDGTAAAGSDYNATSGQLTFAAGQTTGIISVAVIGTTLSELAKAFQITLTGPVNASLSRSQAVCTINNDNLIATDGTGYQAVAYPYDPTVLTPNTFGATTLIGSGDDETATLSLGSNKFNFFGTTYSSLFVSSNGLVTFGSPTNEWVNTDLTSDPGQPAIAPLWDDWMSTNGYPMVISLMQDTNGDGSPDRLIIEWNNVQYSGGSPWTQTFQVDLQLNTGNTPGDIVFNYYFLDSQDEHAHGATATVGIKGPGSNQMLISFNDDSNPYLTSYSAIRITQSNPFASSTASASGVASFVSSDLDGSSQPPSVPGLDDNGFGQHSGSHRKHSHRPDRKVDLLAGKNFDQPFADTRREDSHADANDKQQQKSNHLFDDLFAHEQVGEQHLPFRADGDRLVASDYWIHDNSVYQELGSQS